MNTDDRTKYVVIYAHSFRRHQFLLTLKDRPAFQNGRYNLPGGKLDPEDQGDPVACGRRELLEETGLKPVVLTGDRHQIAHVGTICGNNSLIYVVKCLVNEDEPIAPRPGETEEVRWHGWNRVRDDPRLLPNLLIVVPMCASNVTGWLLEDYALVDADKPGNPQRPHTVQLTV